MEIEALVRQGSAVEEQAVYGLAGRDRGRCVGWSIARISGVSLAAKM